LPGSNSRPNVSEGYEVPTELPGSTGYILGLYYACCKCTWCNPSSERLANIGVGDLVRDEIKKQTHVAAKLQAFSDSGTLAPDAIINQLVERRLKQPDAEEGYILDGFPRNLSQARWLDSTGICVDRVINLTLPEWVILTKLSARRHCPACRRGFNLADVMQADGFAMPKILPDFENCDMGERCPRSLDKLERRQDDAEDIVRRSRLAVHRSETAPLLDFYKSKGLLRSFPVRRGIKDKDSLVDMMLGAQGSLQK
ncbi:unnamed protein product, partial [Ascophyllum nodosum]